MENKVVYIIQEVCAIDSGPLIASALIKLFKFL